MEPDPHSASPPKRPSRTKLEPRAGSKRGRSASTGPAPGSPARPRSRSRSAQPQRPQKPFAFVLERAPRTPTPPPSPPPPREPSGALGGAPETQRQRQKREVEEGVAVLRDNELLRHAMQRLLDEARPGVVRGAKDDTRRLTATLGALAGQPQRQQIVKGALQSAAAVGAAAGALVGLARTRFSEATAEANRRGSRERRDSKAREKDACWRARSDAKVGASRNAPWQALQGAARVADYLKTPIDEMFAPDPTADGVQEVPSLARDSNCAVSRALALRESLPKRLQTLARAGILRSIVIQRTSRGAKVDADEWLDRNGLHEGETAAKLREAGRLFTFTLFLTREFEQSRELERETQKLLGCALQGVCECLWVQDGGASGMQQVQ